MTKHQVDPKFSPPDAVAVLRKIKRCAATKDIFVREHTETRMWERGVSRKDIEHALSTATQCRWQHDHGTWRVTGGVDADGDDLTLAVSLEMTALGESVIIITVFED